MWLPVQKFGLCLWSKKVIWKILFFKYFWIGYWFYSFYRFHLYTCGEHNVSSDERMSRHGIHPIIKEKMEILMKENNIFYPLSLRSALLNSGDHNIEQLMPNLDQIQNWVKYRRHQEGDSNFRHGVEEFVNENSESTDIDDNQLFFFGNDRKLG